jgi:tetratricopeptide (TPR) repeat protein
MGVDELRRTIREKAPVRPSTRLRQTMLASLPSPLVTRHSPLATDLDWIVMKCLEKDRARRYETANGLATDLKRHLNNEPVVARPPSRLYEFQKTVRRHKVGFAAAAAVVVALAAGVIISALEASRAKQAEHEQSRLREAAEKATAREAQLRQQAQTAERQAQAEAARNDEEARFMQGMLQAVGPSVALGRDTVLLREILDQTAQRIGRELTNQPAVEADLRETLGGVYRDLADYTNAEAMLQTLLTLRRNLREPLAVAASLQGLGEVYKRQFKIEDGATAFRDALEIRKKFGKPLDVAASMYGLAEVLRLSGATWSNAMKLHGDALEIRRRFLGDHPDVAKSLVGIGITLRDGHWQAEAETNMVEAVAMLKRLHRDQHLDMAFALSQLGRTRNQLPGRLKDAEDVLQQALAIQRSVLPGEHDQTAATLGYLGDTLLAEGRLTEAEAAYRDSLQIRRKIFIYPRGNSALSAWYAYVDVLYREGKLEAETTLHQALEAYTNAYRQGLNIGYLGCLRPLAKTLASRGRPPEIQALYDVAVAHETRLFRSNDLALSESPTNFVQSATRPGMLLLKRQDTAWSIDGIGAVFDLVGKVTEAEAMYLEELALLQDLEGNDGPDVSEPLLHLSWNLLGQHRFAAAASYAAQDIALWEKLRPDAGDRFNAESLLGACLLRQKDYEQAEKHLLAGYEGIRRLRLTKMVPGLDLRRPTELLIELYEATSRPEQAVKVEAEAAGVGSGREFF